MKVLIKQAHVVDPGSSHSGTIRDIFLEKGVIKEIAPELNPEADQVIQADDLYVSPGWVDVFAFFADPGYEFKETLETGSQAAAAGGFTDVFVIPDTLPVTDSKSQVEYLRHRSSTLPVNIRPIGAVTRKLEGKSLAEMYDMQHSGAVAFSDGLHPIQSSGILLKALQYVKAFDGVIIQIPDDTSIAPNGLINEGVVSTRLGLPGRPMMSEELIIARDIKLARYTDSRIHFTGVSSPKSIEYIRRAKEGGLKVTCSVTPYHLIFSDEDLTGYDTNLKVYPPLRPKKEIEGLKAALLDGTIDCIATHHLPHEYDSKVLEFENAKYGMTGLETAYAALQTNFPQLGAEKMAALFGGNARRIFQLEQPTIEKNSIACLTLFQPLKFWTFHLANARSKSKNSAFQNYSFKGKPLGIVRNETVFLTD